MRLLQVLPHLSKGGAERVVVELSNALIDAGHEVTLLMAFPVEYDLNQKYLDKRIKVQFVSQYSTNRILAYAKIPFYIARYWRVLKTYDAIHCHLTYGLAFGSLISFFRKIAQKENPRLIATCHIVGVGISNTPRMINERLSYFFDVFALMAQDAQWRDYMSKQKRRNFKIVVNGISENVRVKKLEQSNRKACWTIGTISRLQAERKPWLFLEIFSHVNELTKGEVRFILGGEGPEREALTKLSEKLRLNSNLSMPGLVKDPYVVFEELDLYVGLNVEEITGIAGLEAVFAGVPVVGIQFSPNYTKGANDWIWSDQDPVIVARKIVEHLKNPKQLSVIADKQYKVATERFSVERMREHYLDLYKVKM